MPKSKNKKKPLNNKRKIYRLSITKQKMKELGFHYDFFIEDYIYEFPVYRLNGRPLLICKLGVDDGLVWYNIYDTNNNLYCSYYDREYGRSTILPIIDRNIKKEFAKLGITESKE